MVFRFLIQLLGRFGNNEQVIQKLADSRAMRRSAQFVAYFYHRSNAALGSTDPMTGLRNRFFSFKKSFLHEFREEMSKAKKKIKD